MFQIYNVYLTIVQYFVPLIVINGAYFFIAYTIWLAKPAIDSADDRSRRFNKRKRKV